MSAAGRDLLIVEDDAEIRLFLKTALAAEGFSVSTAVTGREAQAMAGNREYDLFIVDLGLPDVDGIDVVRSFRGRSQAPILILSAQTDEVRKIEALDAGADDYVTKPFGIGELRARLRAALRRTGEAASRYELEALRIELDRRRVLLDGAEVHLTPIEFYLLARLARSAGRVVTHRQLISDVWGPEYVEHTHYLRIYMGQLRAKLENDPAVPRYLLTETGVGYRLAGE
jgi:two-component system KDP operon response regulator KdpE